MATPHAYILPQSIDNVLGGGSATSFIINYQCVVGDGVQGTARFATSFIYDAKQTPAVNLANMKQDAANKAVQYGFTVSTANILVFMAVN